MCKWLQRLTILTGQCLRMRPHFPSEEPQTAPETGTAAVFQCVVYDIFTSYIIKIFICFTPLSRHWKIVFARITANTQHLLYPLLPITTLSLFVNAVTTFNYLIAHPFSETNKLYYENVVLWCSLLTIRYFSSYSLCNSVLSVILLKLKWNEMKPGKSCVCIRALCEHLTYVYLTLYFF